MNILCIDTSNKQLYIGLYANNLLFEHKHLGENDHSETLMMHIKDIFEKAQISIDEVSKIIVSEGPGSYTGIRIGMTVAKMFAWDKKIDLFRCSSFLFVLSPFLQTDGIYSVSFDARRNNGFSGIFQVENKQLKVLYGPIFLSHEEFQKMENQYQNIVKLNGSESFEINAVNLIKSKNVYQVDEIHSFTPNYLRKWEE